ncbi:hypothetical protein G9P44_001848 [Scheffersomyces stipitis]|nr:hypothetical protein G9P44_001848 [Scheffersomyces stipitis]
MEWLCISTTKLYSGNSRTSEQFAAILTQKRDPGYAYTMDLDSRHERKPNDQTDLKDSAGPETRRHSVEREGPGELWGIRKTKPMDL